MALLDLIDNSLDAAIVVANTTTEEEDEDDDDFVGRVHIYPDDVECTTPTTTAATVADMVPEVTQSSVITTTTQSQSTRTIRKCTGLCIINNSYKPIRSMEQVLGVYNSSKVNSGAGDIGENGVGLKQGCKFLFVLFCFIFFGLFVFRVYCIILVLNWDMRMK